MPNNSVWAVLKLFLDAISLIAYSYWFFPDRLGLFYQWFFDFKYFISDLFIESNVFSLLTPVYSSNILHDLNKLSTSVINFFPILYD